MVFPFRPLRSSPPSEVCGLCPCPATLPELVLAGEAVHAGKDRGVVFHAETGAGCVGWIPLGAEEWRVRGGRRVEALRRSAAATDASKSA